MNDNIQSIRDQFPIFKSRQGLVYLDSAATSQIPQAVIDAVTKFETHNRSNISRGVYDLSEAATAQFESARVSVSNYINAYNPKEIIFTSGTTDSINLVAHTFGEQLKSGDEIVISLSEHHSNWVPWLMLAERKGLQVKFIPVADDGTLDLSSLDQIITAKCRLICVTHCSNVTGAITDIETLSKAAKNVSAKILIDGAQMVSHGPLDVRKLNVDFYAFSGHKMYAPHGIGILWGRQQILENLPPFKGGGGMISSVSTKGISYAPPPQRFEAGTPPIAQAIGLQAAIQWMETIDQPSAKTRLNEHIKGFNTEIQNQPDLHLIGPNYTCQRVPVLSFTMDGVHPHDISQILNSRGVCVRGGHHCAQPLMEALQIEGCTRASFAVYNDEQDLEALLMGLNQVRKVFS